MLCFGAGVLLATAMLHILPEIREGMEETQESLGISWLAEVVFCAGFLLVYLVEEIVHLTLHRTPHREQFHSTLSLREPADKTDSACNIVEECCESGCSNDMEIKKEVKTPKKTPSTGHGHSHLPTGSSSPMRDFFTGKQVGKLYYFKWNVNYFSFGSFLSFRLWGACCGLGTGNKGCLGPFYRLVLKPFATIKHLHFFYCSAISVHKFVIAFCVSLQLLETGPTMLVFFSYLVTFSLVTPLGIGIGMMISGMGTGDELTSAVLQGMVFGELYSSILFPSPMLHSICRPRWRNSLVCCHVWSTAEGEGEGGYRDFSTHWNYSGIQRNDGFGIVM